MLSARSIAVQGKGFGPLAVALQGFAPVGVVVPPEEEQPSSSSFGYARPRRVIVPSFVQLIEEDELLLLCVAQLLAAEKLS